MKSKERKKQNIHLYQKEKIDQIQFCGLQKIFLNSLMDKLQSLVGSTKGTVSLIRNRTYWNFSNLTAKDPVILGLCTQIQFEKAIEKANRRKVREKKLKEKEAKIRKRKRRK